MASNNGRNPGLALSAEMIERVRVNPSALQRRAETLPRRRSLKREYQAAWLVRALTCIDLTTLAGDDTPGRVHRLCLKARHPLREDLVAALGLAAAPPSVGAVCVYPAMVGGAVRALEGSGIPVASVAGGFPSGLTPLGTRIEEIRFAIAEGASEIDIVINRGQALRQDWRALHEDVLAMREACGDAAMKVILATGDLRTLANVYKASLVCMMAGADFIKTSTGKEDINATLPVSLAMVRAVREYFERTGIRVGFKSAGGVRTARDALSWLILMREELDAEWWSPALFRIGASALLADIERQIEHFVSGRYAAGAHHAMA